MGRSTTRWPSSGPIPEDPEEGPPAEGDPEAGDPSAGDGLPRPAPSDPREEFERLSRKHSARALHLVRLRLGATLQKRLGSEDVLQEVLLEASRLYLERAARRPVQEQGFFPWLSRIIENKVRFLIRHHVLTQGRSIRREDPLPPEDGGRPPQELRTPSKVVMAGETTEMVKKALERLSPRQREVIQLVHWERLRVGEAAERLGKTPNATSVLLHEAHRRLERILNFLERERRDGPGGSGKRER